MGIRFHCPNGHKLNVKSFQAGRKGICPYCGTPVQIPTESTRKSSKDDQAPQEIAPVEIIGAEPGEPLLTQPAASMPAAQPQAAPTPSLQPEPGTPVAQPLGTTPAPSPTPATPAPATPTPTVPTAQVPPAQVPPAQVPPAQVPTAQVPTAAPVEQAPAAPMTPIVPDPLDEAPNAVWYVRPPGGGQFGPAPGDVMRGWIAEGRVAPEAIVWREGWRDWQEASAMFPQLAPDPAVAGLEKIASADASATSPTGRPHHAGSRKQSNSFNTAIITVLVLAVVVLFGVFVWVLTNQPAP